ncbi:MAG: hypothetical protein JSR58_03580 [Verrucomicrobia bacterium]|nr:hypothetical protein [Verrucomicrobiota bacterium]
MERVRFNYNSLFNNTLNANEIGQLFQGYKTDPALNLLLQEAQIDSDALPGRNREVLETLATHLFQETMQWYPPFVKYDALVKFDESQLTAFQLRWFFDNNNTYHNLSKIFANYQVGMQFVADARQEGFMASSLMIDYFVEKIGFPKFITSDLKLDANWSLIQYCVLSKCPQISLSGCNLQGFPQFAHAENVVILDLEWNFLQAADLSAYTQLISLDLSHNWLTQVPSNLPDTLKRLYLSGNFLLILDFKRLPSCLEELSICYMANMIIPNDFWKLLDGRTMTLMVSFDMKIMPAHNYDLSNITFMDQFDREGTIEEGVVVFDLPNDFSSDNTPTSSMRSSEESDEELEGWA